MINNQRIEAPKEYVCNFCSKIIKEGEEINYTKIGSALGWHSCDRCYNYGIEAITANWHKDGLFEGEFQDYMRQHYPEIANDWWGWARPVDTIWTQEQIDEKQKEFYQQIAQKVDQVPLPQSFLFDDYFSASAIYLTNKEDLKKIIAPSVDEIRLYKNGEKVESLSFPGWFVILYSEYPCMDCEEWIEGVDVYPLKEFLKDVEEVYMALKALIL